MDKKISDAVQEKIGEIQKIFSEISKMTNNEARVGIKINKALDAVREVRKETLEQRK